MTSIHLLQSLQDGLHPLTSQASSATLCVTQLSYDTRDGAADSADMIIAQGLLHLHGPQIPDRHDSFLHPMHNQQNPALQENATQSQVKAEHGVRLSRQGISSNTWTSSSGDSAEYDGYDDRTPFVQEYNRLAKKYGIQLITPDEVVTSSINHTPPLGNWILRKLLRRTSSFQSPKHRVDKTIKHKRSISDLPIRMKSKKDALKDKSIGDLVRLCGATPLYLPAEYATGILAVPTCFRATAQYLAQHGKTHSILGIFTEIDNESAADTRGIFRIPGSHNTVNALYNHYASQEEEGEIINGTVRCPMLPEHIPYNVHDVASAFKKFLAGLPGGILGKAWILNALFSIYSQLDATAELTRTKKSKVRAHLIALLILCTAPRYQRELICAVFGLLSLTGRAAETAPREDEQGRPLPTSDLMGYGALGIVFGPLLVGELLDNYDLSPSDSHSTLAFIQRSPSKHSKNRQRKNKSIKDSYVLKQNTEKIKIINSITEMLITHWRDVVRHMKNLGVLRSSKGHYDLAESGRRILLRPSVSESFVLRKPPKWRSMEMLSQQLDRSSSPTPLPRNVTRNSSLPEQGHEDLPQNDLLVRKQRPRPKLWTTQTLSNAKSMSVLSPTNEESLARNTNHRHSLHHTNDNGERDCTPTQRNARNAVLSTQSFHIKTSQPIEKAQQGHSVLLTSTPISNNYQNSSLGTESVGENSIKQFNYTPACSSLKSRGSHRIPLIEETVQEPDSNTMDTARRPEAMVVGPLNPSPYSESEEQSDTLRRELIGEDSFKKTCKATRTHQSASSEVPLGIVSQRLCGIIANAPCVGPLSSFRATGRANSIESVGKSGISCPELGNLGTFPINTVGPSAMVSHEEDLASLALLAKAMSSQGPGMAAITPLNSKKFQRSVTLTDIVKDSNSMLKSTVLEIKGSQFDLDRKSSSINEAKKIQISIQNSGLKADKALVTQRNATNSSLQSNRVTSSVRTLAAKFDISQTSSSYPSTPINSPNPPRLGSHRLESPIFSTNMVNSSTTKSKRSDTLSRSAQTVANSFPVKIETTLSREIPEDSKSSSSPKPASIAAALIQDSSTPRMPHSLSSIRSPLSDSSSARNLRSGLTVTQVPSSISTKGGEPLDMHPSENKNHLKAVSVPEQQTSAKVIPSERPQTPRFLQSSSPSSFRSTIPYENTTFVQERSPITIVDRQPKSRGTSMLYIQIQQLQKQLNARTNEVEQLWKQLSTRTYPDEVGTLRAQLIQTNKDLKVWRNRAETAEGNLNALSYLLPKESLEMFTRYQRFDNRGLKPHNTRSYQYRRPFEHDLYAAILQLREREDNDGMQESKETVRRSEATMSGNVAGLCINENNSQPGKGY